MRTLVFLLAGLLSAAALPADRLPHDIVPTHYVLHFDPDVNAGRFTAQESVDVSLQRPIRQIAMHAADLDIGRAWLNHAGRRQELAVKLDRQAEQVLFELPRSAGPGPATLEIEFAGPLRDDQRGWYRGEMFGRPYLATHMEPTDARRMFPAFDEPLYKATFSVSVVVPEGMTAIANGAVLSETPLDGGKRRLQFATVGKMPSYLLALVVGHFECIGDQAGNTPIRVCSAPEQIGQAPFALRMAKEALLWQEDYFGIPYPYGKLDHVAIPDFAIGAMENVGAILYRSRLLLVDETRSALSDQRRIASIISHETAHQWFGNLVSLKWWDDTWLKEGFASWMENGSLLAHHPEWRIENEYAGSRRTALAADARPSAPAIRRNVKSSSDIRSAFDSLSYQKAAAVIRMLETHAGETAFRDAVRTYFRANSWGNATLADFLAALGDAGEIYPRALAAFTSRPGAPLLQVDAGCEDGVRHVRLRQQRLAGDTSAEPWPIPLCLNNGGERHCLVVEKREHTIELPGCDAALFGNAGGSGYYVTEHDADTLRALQAALYTQLDATERQTLFNDEWLLVQQGRRDASDMLELYARVRPAEDDELVAVIGGPLAYIAGTSVADEQRAAFAAYIRRIFRDPAMKLGWESSEGDTPQVREARRRNWNILGTLGKDPDAARHASEMSDAWLNGAKVDASMLPVALSIAGQHGGKALHARALDALRGEEDPQRMNHLLNLLGAFDDPALIQATLHAALSDAVRPNEALRLIDGARYAGPRGAKLAWEFMQKNAEAVLAKLPAGHRPYAVLVASGVCDSNAIAEAEAFARNHPAAADATKLGIVRDDLRRCEAFRARHTDNVRRFLTASH